MTFEHCIIAAGATTKLLPGTRSASRVVTYEEQILADELPRSIIIAGAGAIGVEFAYVLHNYGVKVTIVEFLDRSVPLEDEEVSAELGKRYKRLGIEVRTGTRVESIEESGRRGTGDGLRRRQAGDPGGRQGAAGHRVPAAGRGLRPGETGVRLTRAGRHRDRRPRPDERAAHLRDR